MIGICRRYTLLLLLITGLGHLATWAQPVQLATLTGQITNATDGKPLPFASVYVNGTTKGTTADDNGRFSLANVPFGANELVASYTGFSAVRQPIRITETKPQPIFFALSPVENVLTGVVVTAKKDKNWLRQVDQFKRDLIGTSPFAALCTLVNPEVIQFEEMGGLLIATASEPLLIDNQALGFRLTYTLLAFRSFSRTSKVVFGGTTLFRELPATSPRQAKLWEKNRLQAYQGSLRHLLASLAAGTHEKEGFRVFQTNPVRPLLKDPTPMLSSEVGRHLKPFDARVLVAPGTLPHERWLVSNTPLEVLYTRIASDQSPYGDAQYAFSELVLPQQSLGFTVTGQITAPRGFDAIGYLSNDRLATALPDDWQRDSSPATMAARADSGRIQPEIRPEAAIALDSLKQRWRRQAATTTRAVFVHIDKPLYLTGDQLWLSGYVLDGQSQRCDTALFGPALNVELWSATNTLVQHQWLPVKLGRTVGSFRLSDTLSTGTYWLRAYTEADRQREIPPFERPLWIANPKTVTVMVDQEGSVIQAEAVRGLTPAVYEFVEEAPGAPYRTTVAIDTAQITLTLDARSKKQFATVFALIEARGKLVQTAYVPVRAPSTTVRWSTRGWPAGSARLSLMDSTGRVWAKRTIQILARTPTVVASVVRGAADSAPSGLLTVKVYDETGRPTTAQLSIAVTDAELTPADSLVPNLATHLLTLDSRPVTYPTAGGSTTGITLHGQVAATEKQPVNVALVVTDGQGVLARTTQTDANGHFQVGQLTLPDTAQAMVQVTNRRGKPVDATVSFGRQAAPFGSVPYWPNGARLFTLWQPVIEAARQRRQQEGGRQRPEAVVPATRPPADERPVAIQLRSLHRRADQTVLIDERSPAAENLYYLLQARVPGVRVEPVLTNGRVAYAVTCANAATGNPAVAALPVGQGNVALPKPTDGPLQNPLFLLDGFPIQDTDGTQLLAFSPASIDRIELVEAGTSPAVYGAQGRRGVIAFYTKATRDLAKAKGISRHVLLGYPTAEAFPGSTLINPQPAPRDVLAWEPLAQSDKLGQINVPVPIPPVARLLRVTIQGVSAAGQVISYVQTLPIRNR